MLFRVNTATRVRGVVHQYGTCFVVNERAHMCDISLPILFRLHQGWLANSPLLQLHTPFPFNTAKRKESHGGNPMGTVRPYTVPTIVNNAWDLLLRFAVDALYSLHACALERAHSMHGAHSTHAYLPVTCSV